MDFSVLAPTLARYGAPMIAELLDTAAGAVGGPLAGLAVKGVTDFVLARLGTAFGTAPDPAALAPAIEAAAQADPAGTATKLQSVQDDHADLIQRAMAQAQIDEANVESARANTLELVKAGSPVAWGSPVISTVVVVAFAAVAVVVFVKYGVDSAVGQLIAGALIAKFGTVVDYWLGSSKGSADRAADVQGMLRTAISNGVPTGAPSRKAR